MVSTCTAILYNGFDFLSIGKSAKSIVKSIPDCAIMESMSEFTAWLNDAIQSRGWSISYLARQSGFSQSLASDVLNEKVEPSANFAIAVARALGEPPEALLRLAGHLDAAPPPTDLDSTVGDIFRSLPDTQRNAVAVLLSGLAGKEAEHAPTAPSWPVQAADGEPLSPLEERMQQHVLAICDVLLPLVDEPTHTYLMARLNILREERKRERERLDPERHPDPESRSDRST